MVAAEAIVVRVVDSPGDLKHANFKRVYRSVLGQRTAAISGHERKGTIAKPADRVLRVDGFVRRL